MTRTNKSGTEHRYGPTLSTERTANAVREFEEILSLTSLGDRSLSWFWLLIAYGRLLQAVSWLGEAVTKLTRHVSEGECSADRIRGWPVLEQAGCVAQETRAASPIQKLAPTSTPSFLCCAPRCPNRGHPREVTGTTTNAKRSLSHVDNERSQIARPGFEPGLNDSESFVLPLHHQAIFSVGREYRRVTHDCQESPCGRRFMQHAVWVARTDDGSE